MRRRKINHLCEALSTVYEINQNFRIDRHYVPMYFPNERVVVEFCEYSKESKRIQDLESHRVFIFCIPHNESIYTTIGRLNCVLRKIQTEKSKPVKS